MTQIRLTSFNCENLMMRYEFGKPDIPDLRNRLTLVSDQKTAEEIDRVFNVLSEDDRTLTAQTLAASSADICCLQEVENLVTLTAFHNRYLKRWSRRGYASRILKEGNDTRGIDVAALSRLRPVSVTSHAGLTLADCGIKPHASQSPDMPVFRRDCLEIEFQIEGKTLTVFVCHFKSMNGGRWETRPIRQQEAMAVRHLIERRFETPGTENWLICGDFNDFLEKDGQPVSDHGLGPIFDDGFSIDALMASDLPAMERWTHHYVGDDSYAALDHIFLSPALASLNAKPQVTISRMGMPWRASRYDGFRLPGIAWDRPKASDHCPISIELTL